MLSQESTPGVEKGEEMKFMRYKWLYFLISVLVLAPGILSLFFWGLKPAIDFTGGSLLELKLTAKENQNINSEKISNLVKSEGISVSSVQSSQDDIYLLRTKPIDQEKNSQLQKKLADELGEVEELRFETVGPILGKELLIRTLTALVLAAAVILFFVAIQFKDKKYGICAILAMLHDTFVVLGIFSLLGHFFQVEVDTLFVTAVLTTLSFSVHDTIVVYDRIRESKKFFPHADFASLVDKAVAETLSRSVNNSMTIIFMLLALFVLGGATIKWFVLALLIGAISGTYSSPFTAAPLLVVWDKFKKK